MQICIVGGGVVGLNTALALSEKGHDIFLFDKEKYLGAHTSTRNSEVIHAGFAYPPNSLKARLCIEGNKLTYDLLTKLKVPFKRCGKWVIACGPEEDKALKEVKKNADICGVKDFEFADIDRLESEEKDICNVTSVIFSGNSGIMDASAYIRALEVELSKKQNVNLIYPCRISEIEVHKSEIKTDRGPIKFDLLINSAGLWADEIHDMKCRSEDYQVCSWYQIIPFKGEYYKWKNGRIKTMIYPVPQRFLENSDSDSVLTSSMGIHLHRNIAGDLFLGPSQIKLQADKKDDYSIQTSKEDFVRAVSKFIKNIQASELEPAYAGNRPKLYKSGHPVGDFEIFKEGNIIHMLGMESPALTAAPAIGKYIANMI